MTLPEPMRIRDNVFDMFGASADVDKAQGRYAAGHVIRLASSSAETMIDGNRFWAPVQFWGDMPPSGAVNIVNRPDLVLITPAHQLQNSSLINAYTSAADRVDYWWDEDTRPDIEDLHPQPLHFVNNHIGYLPRDEGDLFFGYNISKTPGWAFLNGGAFYTHPEWCEELSEGSNCGMDGATANAFYPTADAWNDAGQPSTDSMESADFSLYREGAGIALQPDRFQNSRMRDRELDTLSYWVRQKRRGAWSAAYDVYALLNVYRHQYGLDAIDTPYLETFDE